MKKRKTIKVLMIIACTLTLMSCESSNMDDVNKSSTNTINNVDTSKAQDRIEDGNQTEEQKYAEDEIVNNFIRNYNYISSSPIDKIKRGNIRTKYYGETFGYWIEMLNVADTKKIVVTIDKTNENANIGMEGMKEVFHDVIKTISSTTSDEDINSYFDKLVSNEYMITEEVFNDIEIKFVSDIELSKGHSRGHIQIRSK